MRSDEARNLKDFVDAFIKSINDHNLRLLELETNEFFNFKLSTLNVSNPPTDAELDAEFGTPATVGDKFLALLDDNDADTNTYLVWSNGTSWWYLTFTKAV